MPEQKHLLWLWRGFLVVLTIIGLWAAIRYVLPLALPLVIALIFARLLEPWIRALHKRLRLPRPVCAALLTVVVLGLLVWLLVAGIGLIWNELNRLVTSLPELMSRLPDITGSWRERVEIWIGAAPLTLQEPLRAILDSAMSEGIQIPGAVYGFLATFITSVASGVPQAVLFCVTTVLSTFFIACDYARITGWLMRPFSLSLREKIVKTKNHFTLTAGRWLKAQCLLIVITFGILLIGLYIIRVEYALLTATVTALLDALPIIGIGLILLPWAAFCILNGQVTRGISLLLLYAVITLTRGLIEPKLVGGQIGLHPLPTLMSMYVGFLLWGIVGMVAAPLMTLMIKQIIDWGWIFPDLFKKK